MCLFVCVTRRSSLHCSVSLFFPLYLSLLAFLRELSPPSLSLSSLVCLVSLLRCSHTLHRSSPPPARRGASFSPSLACQSFRHLLLSSRCPATLFCLLLLRLRWWLADSERVGEETTAINATTTKRELGADFPNQSGRRAVPFSSRTAVNTKQRAAEGKRPVALSRDTHFR